eukprot:CAMPEP_0201629804 /NCGR_PEP_ID=MMETSP0493-20130528/4341_1 /ASSEMBLY_ACC=CAM_ASM_000838 /TAXON_ID=420259 /ORGANISM="Thalassiosira gravida, Strain GMp14c1" /LENGTH=34 /DNA_ID= /DNA_START= /DNA_END= /DNA_ORIENTATION=
MRVAEEADTMDMFGSDDEDDIAELNHSITLPPTW